MRYRVLIGVAMGVACAALFGWLAWSNWKARTGFSASSPSSNHADSPGATVQITPQDEALLARIEDPVHREFVLATMTMRGRTPSESDLKPFLGVVATCSTDWSDQERQTDRVDLEISRVTQSFNQLADAWLRAGPFETSRAAIIRDAVRCAEHPDLNVRVSDAVLLMAVRDNPGSEGFPDEAAAALEHLLSHGYVNSIATKRYEAWKAEAGAGSK